jgi:hypothetical protein
MTQFVVPPLSRGQLRQFAYNLRKTLGLEKELRFPVILFLEFIMPTIFKERFHYEIIPKGSFHSCKHADFDAISGTIRIREDVYYNAVNGSGRDRMTVLHEICHFLLIFAGGAKLSRAFDDQPVPSFRDPEWQAKAFAGEIMCPHHLIGGMSVKQVEQACGVSIAAASLAVDKRREVV